MTVAVEGGSEKTRRGSAPRRGPISRIRQSYNRNWYAWAMVAPVVAVIGVLVVYPLIRGIYLSLTDANSNNVGKTIGVNKIPDSFSWVGFDNYTEILSGGDHQFWPHFTWTIVWTVVCVALHYSIGMGLALLLNRKLRGRTFYRMVLILPWAVPTFVTVFAWRLILADDGGVLNLALDSLHLPTAPWLSDPFWQRTAAIMVNTWVGVPFMMVSLLGGLQSIPSELYEAAEVDGATPWQRFRHVTVPGLRSVSSTVVLLGIIWTFNQFVVIFLLFGATGAPEAQILVTWAYRLGFGQDPRDYAGSAAYGVIILSMLIVFASFYRRWLARNEKAV
ncbi:carbohydrate ABC transporter permease [Streptomyces sp. NBC_01481]|uniref:carbohydrate ABC transporter permease n=1 Tax=unclassified Streptomyces TaxID=2593676 RepID=UPI002259B6B2|nr:sugar ABC transporter permease [Streptomyces sp. NBC_01481]MCX4582638.1 sugar ABC transporter permease [Streptomyces sp. NBC_01481]